MDSYMMRSKHLESVVSVIILAVLFIIAVGVLIKQKPAEAEDLAFLLPAGFVTLSEMEVYEADNLYEKINGKAPLYIESGFKELTTQRFAGRSDDTLVMEIYVFDMGVAKNAFTVYSVQKRADVKLLTNMQFAYKTSNAFYLAYGKYYIEMIGFSESQRLIAVMAEVAKKIPTHLNIVGDTGIPEIKHLPRDNLVSGSIKLYQANAFGSEKLNDIFAAKYELDGEAITAFLGKRSSANEADAVAQNYRNFLVENGGKRKQAINKNLKGMVFDFYDTTEIVLSTGAFVVGVHEAENQKAAEELVIKLIKKLRGGNQR